MWSRPQFHQYFICQVFLKADLSIFSLIKNLHYTIHSHLQMYMCIRTYCLYFVYLIVRVDEIVVGAPTYSEGSNINIGQIHIYMNLTNVSL